MYILHMHVVVVVVICRHMGKDAIPCLQYIMYWMYTVHVYTRIMYTYSPNYCSEVHFLCTLFKILLLLFYFINLGYTYMCINVQYMYMYVYLYAHAHVVTYFLQHLCFLHYYCVCFRCYHSC